ncbi:DUF4394 domain-containing protein [Hymenobacter sp. BT188]|uniref:DUF4394 domain-containing protein n=1 Tax=Hymenobacter sp. BT188 TaxID=2763504 RepID=UPI0016513455|nr:DUF4394 domain-containing protein [Hymenobacter sp. BT188]MBC6608713.1 DUF4394 domain-containing protein [Hymenobacter sp. BT188]
MVKTFSLAKWGMAVLLLLSLSSCEDILEQYFPKPTPPTIPTFPPLGQDIAFYALAGGTQLDAYSTANAATRTSSVSITGLTGGERILAIDFRPATGQLYGVSSASRLYVINQNTGRAHAIGTGPFTPAVQGNLVGFDFNPTVDRIRVVSNTGQNLRLNPETGTVANTDSNINGATGAMLTGVAYTNNTAGATTTALYAINTLNKYLYLVPSPNAGTVAAVGNLNLPVSGEGGFDIDAKTGTALGLYNVHGKPTLFTLDLATGAARTLAQYSTSLDYVGIAIPTRAVAYSLGFSISGGSTPSLSVIDLTNPVASAIVNRPITGLSPDDALIGLDFRPATGQLYALSVQRPPFPAPQGDNRLYTINPATGAATLVATLNVRVDDISPGFDFNPVVDRIRIVTSSGQNLRVNPTDGTVVEDAALNPSGRGIYTAAYSNNFVGATSTTLYVMGQVPSGRFTSVATLYQQNPPNAGTLVSIGDLGIPAVATGSFDIGGTSNNGYALLNIFGSTDLYSIDLSTGRATRLNEGGNYNLVTSASGFAVGLGF